jgi:hypothetical protein
MKRHQFRPNAVESLENLALLSAGVAHLPAALVPARAVAPNPRIHLVGAIGGNFVSTISAATGRILNVAAIGTVAPLGQVNANGIAVQSQSTRNPSVYGTLVIYNSQGTITLSIHANLPKHGNALPTQFSYSIISGTDAYATAQDHGTVKLSYNLASVDAAGTAQGTFGLRFSSARGR